MRIKVVSDVRIAQLRRHPSVYRFLRGSRFTLGRLLPPKSVPGVPGRLSLNDFMLHSTDPESIRGYAEGGKASAQLMVSCAEQAGLDPAEAVWLELGCGYGRVVRFLVERVPAAMVSVTDSIPAAIRFCAREFGVTAVPVLDGRADQRGRYDVIYAISVLTHLPVDVGAELLATMAGALAPGGVLIFTTHGQSCLAEPERYGPEFAGMAADIRAEFENIGAAYRPYIYVKDASYGVTWHTEAHVDGMVGGIATATFARLAFVPQGLEGHQDLHVFQRTG
jgi:SAM-dependent methyltransferase